MESKTNIYGIDAILTWDQSEKEYLEEVDNPTSSSLP